MKSLANLITISFLLIFFCFNSYNQLNLKISETLEGEKLTKEKINEIEFFQSEARIKYQSNQRTYGNLETNIFTGSIKKEDSETEDFLQTEVFNYK